MELLKSLVALQSWPLRRWLVAAATSIGFALLVAIPTDLVDTPVFGREIPPTWWSWPALAVSSVLGGLLVATYVNPVTRDAPAQRRGGYVGGLLTYFAVGCPVCNKLVLLALGSAGAITWFQPLQPLLQVAASLLLTWSLLRRLQGERFCPVTGPSERTPLVHP
jgi:hypothetical protein